jgi:hypothetical protein
MVNWSDPSYWLSGYVEQMTVERLLSGYLGGCDKVKPVLSGLFNQPPATALITTI